MAHEIATVAGKSAFYSAKVPAWHGLGQVVDTAQSSAEAMRLAGLDWEVASLALGATFAGGAHDGLQASTDDFGHFRVEDGKAIHLGTVKGRYKLVQNREAFDFLDALHADGVLKYETAGALGVGERIFMSAKIPCADNQVADSAIERYLLLFNSHDGSSGLEVMPTTTRVVCANTLRVARGACAEKLAFRHCASIGERMAQAAKMMDAAGKSFDNWMILSRGLVGKRMSDNEVQAVVDAVYPPLKDDANKLAKERRQERVDAFWRVYRQEATQANIHGTAWGALNAFTFLEDHGDAILKGNKAEGRFLRSQEGAGNTAKIAAWNMLVAA